MTRRAVGQLLVIAASLALLFDSAGPWYEAKPAAIQQAVSSYTNDCTRLSGASRQAYEDGAAAALRAALHGSTDPGSPASLAGFAWQAWPAGPHAWGPVLLLLTAAGAIIFGVVRRPRTRLMEAVTAVAITGAVPLIALAVVDLPSPDGSVPGSEVWTRGWALWFATACVLVAVGA